MLLVRRMILVTIKILALFVLFPIALLHRLWILLWKVRVFAAGALLLAAFGWVLVVLPERQVASLKDVYGVSAMDVKDAENRARATWAQILGGAILLVGLGFTWRRIDLAREGQITDRYIRAIEQLGNDKTEVRIGAVYALERISRESQRDHWPIMEILATYVRDNALWNDAIGEQLPATPNSTVKAILRVFGRRNRKHETEQQFLDLEGPTYAKLYSTKYILSELFYLVCISKVPYSAAPIRWTRSCELSFRRTSAES